MAVDNKRAAAWLNQMMSQAPIPSAGQARQEKGANQSRVLVAIEWTGAPKKKHLTTARPSGRRIWGVDG